MPVTLKLRTASDALKSELSSKTREDRRTREADVGLASIRAGSFANDLQPEIRLEHRPLNSIKLMKHRVRKGTAAQVARLTASVKQSRYLGPILIRSDGTLIDGEVRLKVARGLGFETVPCIVVDHLDDEQIRQLRLAINRMAELGEWDFDELQVELQELISLDVPVLDLGFTEQEIDIMAHVGAANDDDDDGGDDDDLPPAPAGPAVTKPGDVWQLGKHRLICGDSLKAVTYAALMGGAVAAAVITDPPFNLKIQGVVTSNKKHKDFAMAAGEMSDAEFTSFLTTFLTAATAHAKKGSLVYAFIDWRTCHQLVLAGLAAKLKHLNTLIWNKGAGGMGSLYRSAHEMIVLFCNGDKPHTNNIELGKHGRDRTNVMTYAGANRKGSSANKALADHPTPKPIELIADLMLDCTKAGDIVLDPFLGSGTTIMAAERTKRIGYGIELDPGYCDVIVRRWEAATGERAVHADTGMSFSETAHARAREDSKEG